MLPHADIGDFQEVCIISEKCLKFDDYLHKTEYFTAIIMISGEKK
jgi:hypothetical protein